MAELFFEEHAGTAERVKVEQTAILKRRLEEMVWDAADRIGNPSCWHKLADYSDDEMTGYADGIKNSIHGLAEYYLIDISTHQIDAAIGERLRRMKSKRQKLCCRRFNNLIERIRDKRIAMLDNYELLNYRDEFKPLQKKVWRLERQGCETDQEIYDFQILQRELVALFGLGGYLTLDRDWMKRHYELRQAKTEVAA